MQWMMRIHVAVEMPASPVPAVNEDTSAPATPASAPSPVSAPPVVVAPAPTPSAAAVVDPGHVVIPAELQAYLAPELQPPASADAPVQVVGAPREQAKRRMAMSDSLAGQSRVVAKARMAMARAMPTKISYEEAVSDPRFLESILN
jgi:hypothetical protein